jgi:hypothetical protein
MSLSFLERRSYCIASHRIASQVVRNLVECNLHWMGQLDSGVLHFGYGYGCGCARGRVDSIAKNRIAWYSLLFTPSFSPSYPCRTSVCSSSPASPLLLLLPPPPPPAVSYHITSQTPRRNAVLDSGYEGIPTYLPTCLTPQRSQRRRRKRRKITVLEVGGSGHGCCCCFYCWRWW